MSKAAPTPGPWYVSNEPLIPGLAEVRTHDGSGPMPYKVATCHDNDARLIAAAPDLLRACSLLCLGPAHPDWAAHVEQAWAAIAKAKGRDSE